MMKPVFLSASEPYPTRDRDYWDSGRLANIRAAVRALCAHVLPYRPLVFGGHPAITPLVRGIAERVNHDERQRGQGAPPSRVITFRSRLYGDDDTPGTMMVDAYNQDGRRVEREGGRRNMSLLRLRYEMIGGPGVHFPHPFGEFAPFGSQRYDTLRTWDFAAGIFIGGMEGVEREFRIFRSFHPETPAYPIATTGAAAARLFAQAVDRDQPSASALLNDSAYGVLFQRLPFEREERGRVAAGSRSEALDTWRDHLDPDELDGGMPSRRRDESAP